MFLNDLHLKEGVALHCNKLVEIPLSNNACANFQINPMIPETKPKMKKVTDSRIDRRTSDKKWSEKPTY